MVLEPELDRAISKFYEDSAPRLLACLVAQGFSAHDSADAVQQAVLEALPPVWEELDNPYGLVSGDGVPPGL